MGAEALSTVRDCYQCQKCSAGCPVVSFMDYKPHQVMQMINLGEIVPLLSSRTIWVCASCYTCSTRCPNEVDVAGAMDGLRERALAEKIVPAEVNVRLFHRAFLGDIRAYGRVHELSMMARYKMATKTYLDDMRLGWRMFTRGKLKLFPSFVRNRKEIARLFADKGR
jgi:heterodisulfide reductase subunit C